MTHAAQAAINPRTAIRRRRLATWLIAAASALVVATALVAAGSGLGLIALPIEMFLLAERMPVIFKLHMVASALALLLVPAVIAVRHRPIIHRMLGRLLGAFVLIGGLTALPVAVASTSDLVARAGFFVQGLVWLALLGAGVIAIRRGRRLSHAKLMLAMVAVTSGAVWFRIATGAAILLELPFEPIYAASAWLGWLLPLAVVFFWPGLARGLLRGPEPVRPASRLGVKTGGLQTR